MAESDMTKEQQILIRLLGLNDTDRSWLAIFSEIASLLDSLVIDCDGNQLTQSDFDAVMSSLAAARDKARCHGVLASGSSVIDQETFDGIMRGVGDVIENASEELEDAIGRNAKCVVECAKRDDEIASLKAQLTSHTEGLAKEVLASDGSVIDQETFDGIMRVMRGAIDEANEEVGRKDLELEDAIRLADNCLDDCSEKDEEIATLKAELAKHTWRPISECDKHIGAGVITLLKVHDAEWYRINIGWRDSNSNWHYTDMHKSREHPIKEHPTHFAHLPMDPK